MNICAEIRVDGKDTYRCDRPLLHEGSHFDSAFNAGWANTLPQSFRAVPRPVPSEPKAAYQAMKAERDAALQECIDVRAEMAKISAHRHQLQMEILALVGVLKNCRNGLELLLQSEEPDRPDDPWDTINELRETVKTATAAIRSSEPTQPQTSPTK